MSEKEEVTKKEDKVSVTEIPGTARIRKLGLLLQPIELLELCANLAQAGEDKKLWSVLSRVYGDKKHFAGQYQSGMEVFVDKIMNSNVPAELKLQTFTSFQLPVQLVPEQEQVSTLIANCAAKRINIASYFLSDYPIAVRQYDDLIANRTLFKYYLKSAKQLDLIHFYDAIIQKESKEFITGALRQLYAQKRHYRYPELSEIQKLTDTVFESKQVFFTTKLLYCITFDVPKSCLPEKKEIYDILKICINYDEKITREFAEKYEINFNSSDAAICRYYLGNKKTQNEKELVEKFAAHVVRVEDEVEKSKLLHFAFKRGGLFRMYAGCMQDGEVNVEKQKRFRYSDEQIAWVSSLPGLKA